MLDIRHLRQRLSLTQRALARELGVSRRTIIRWEHAKNAPHVIFCMRLIELREAFDAIHGPEPTIAHVIEEEPIYATP